MSKNWKITIPSAKVYDIPWESKNDINIEQCRYQTAALELPKKTNAHLWLMNLSAFNHIPFLESLSSDERDKLNRLITPVERESRAKSRIALRLILAEYLNTSPSEIVFSYGENGKPTLKTPLNKVSFNISHSANNLAVLIDSHRSIGVDIESELRPNKVGIQLAKRFFHKQEFSMLQNLKSKEQSILFNRIWTLKEAVLKSTGTGMFLIDEAPDFSCVIRKNTGSNLQFYKTKNHAGFTLYTEYLWLSTAAED
jgi:phosphopantetheine--protein transferase-like protein